MIQPPVFSNYSLTDLFEGEEDAFAQYRVHLCFCRSDLMRDTKFVKAKLISDKNLLLVLIEVKVIFRAFKAQWSIFYS